MSGEPRAMIRFDARGKLNPAIDKPRKRRT